MDISSILQAIFDPRLNRSAWFQEIIKPGDVFRLKVIDVKDNHRVLVDFGKFRATAEVKFPVKPGVNLLVKVTDTEGQLRLQLIDPKSGAAGSNTDSSQLKILSFELFERIQSDIRKTANHIFNLPEDQQPPKQIIRALAVLNDHFEVFNLNRNLKKGILLLQTKFEDSGLFFEKKMAEIINKMADRSGSDLAREMIRSPEIQRILATDLKPILLTLSQYLETPDAISKFLNTKSLSRFKGTLELLLTDIGSQQSRAVQRRDLPDPYQMFSFALPLKENQKKAQMKVYCPKRKQDSKRAGFKVSLLLDMDRIGEVRTDFFLLKKDLSITFFVKNMEGKKQFEDHFEEIRETLHSSFDYLVLKAVISEKKIQDFNHEDFDLDMERQIDLRA